MTNASQVSFFFPVSQSGSMPDTGDGEGNAFAGLLAGLSNNGGQSTGNKSASGNGGPSLESDADSEVLNTSADQPQSAVLVAPINTIIISEERLNVPLIESNAVAGLNEKSPLGVVPNNPLNDLSNRLQTQTALGSVNGNNLPTQNLVDQANRALNTDLAAQAGTQEIAQAAPQSNIQAGESNILKDELRSQWALQTNRSSENSASADGDNVERQATTSGLSQQSLPSGNGEQGQELDAADAIAISNQNKAVRDELAASVSNATIADDLPVPSDLDGMGTLQQPQNTRQENSRFAGPSAENQGELLGDASPYLSETSLDATDATDIAVEQMADRASENRRNETLPPAAINPREQAVPVVDRKLASGQKPDVRAENHDVTVELVTNTTAEPAQNEPVAATQFQVLAAAQASRQMQHQAVWNRADDLAIDPSLDMPVSSVSELQSASSEQAANSPTDRAPTSRTPIGDQLLIAINQARETGQQRMTVNLRPAELGAVEISIEMASDGMVQAQIVVEKPETLEMLQKESGQLQERFAEAGIALDGGQLEFSMRDDNPRDGDGQDNRSDSDRRLSDNDTNLGKDQEPASSTSLARGLVDLSV